MSKLTEIMHKEADDIQKLIKDITAGKYVSLLNDKPKSESIESNSKFQYNG